MSTSGFGAWDVSPLHSHEPAAPPSIPERLGEYQVRGVIGHGGMGMVLRGYHPVLESEVAIKILRPLPIPDPTRLERFRREAMASARLRHPNIVGVHTVGQHGELPFLVMDLVEGESLDQRLKRGGPLDCRQAAQLALGLAEALEHAHDRQVVHRDLKPSNVFLTPQGQPLLGDFGLAKVQDASGQGLTGTRDVLGTPGYMAPEQARGGLADARADIYALGATLYAMLVGHPPHQAESLLAFLDQLARQPARPVRELRRQIPADLAYITMRCLARDPGERYPSARALAGDLRRHLAGERVRPGTPWLSRLVLGAAACMLVAAGALATRAVRQGGLRGDPLREVRAALDAGQAQSARTLVDRVLAEQPGLPDALALRSRALEQLGQLEAADADLSALLELRPDDAEPWLRRAHLRRRIGRREAALADFGAAIERGATCWRDRGELLEDLGRNLAAAEDFARAVELTPDDAGLWRDLAWARGRARDFAGCREALERAKQLDPDHVVNWLIQAELVAPSSIPDAIRCYDQAIELDPDNPQLYIQRSQYRTQIGDWSGIVADCTRAIELDPERPDGWNNRASAYYELKKFRQAQLDYQRAIELDPDQPLLYAHRAMTWLELRELIEGFADVERALALEPGHPQALFVKAHLLALDGRLGEAAEVARQVAARPSPVRVDAWALLGQLHVAEQRWRDAVEMFDKVLGARPRDVNALFNRGMALANAGRLADAAVDLQRFVQLAHGEDPRRGAAEQALRDVQAQLGR